MANENAQTTTTPTAQDVAAVITGQVETSELKLHLLTDDDCDTVRQLAGLHDYQVDEDSEMHGKKYVRFMWKGKVFVVPADDKFIADFNAGDIKQIEISEDAEGYYGFAGHVTNTQYNARQQNKLKQRTMSVLQESIDITNVEKISKFVFA